MTTPRKPFQNIDEYIGSFPPDAAIVAFHKALSLYKQAKGSVQFPIDKPISFSLVRKIVKYRVKRNLEIGKRGN